MLKSIYLYLSYLPVLLLYLFGIIAALPVMLLAREGSGRYAKVNNLNMYYEIHGNGKPLVLIHGGGSSIETTFGKILPFFAQNRMVIAVELQAHGHTQDINRPLSFEQDADDVAELLKQININKADFFGFSNGGTTALQIGIRHPEIVNKLIIGSANYKKEGMPEQLRNSFREDLTPDAMPAVLREDYLKKAPDTSALSLQVKKLMHRLINFKNIPGEDMAKIIVPALIIAGDKDAITPEHAVEMYRALPNSSLVILPGGHGEYIGEATSFKEGSPLPGYTAQLIEDFLDAPVTNISRAGAK
jgi:pimeloyl-ACP methyl ester carboxylesterase